MKAPVLADPRLWGWLAIALTIGGLALLAFFVNLMLVPVVLFFLLRDWNTLVERLDAMIPRHLHERARAIFGEIDAVLAEFLRGQLMLEGMAVTPLLVALRHLKGAYLAGPLYRGPN